MPGFVRNDTSFAQQFDASGATVGSEIAVNTTTLGNQQLPVIADLVGGGLRQRQ